MPSWDDPNVRQQLQDPRVPGGPAAVKAGAEFVHRNESMHRHTVEGPTCVYCAIVARNALAGAMPELIKVIAEQTLRAVTDATITDGGLTIEALCRWAETGELNEAIAARVAALSWDFEDES